MGKERVDIEREWGEVLVAAEESEVYIRSSHGSEMHCCIFLSI